MQIGTTLIIIGVLVGAGGALIIHYGYKLNQQVSEQKILAQQKKSETAIRADIKELKIAMSKLQKSKEGELSSQFPAGYQLFAIVDKKIIPSQKPSSDKLKISWDTAKILNVTKDFVDIKLPDAILPGDNIFENNIIRVKKEEGLITKVPVVMHGWSPFVKILKSDEKEIIAAVGYAKIS